MCVTILALSCPRTSKQELIEKGIIKKVTICVKILTNVLLKTYLKRSGKSSFKVIPSLKQKKKTLVDKQHLPLKLAKRFVYRRVNFNLNKCTGHVLNMNKDDSFTCRSL